MSRELYDRNREIYKLKLQKATYQELAFKYMLSLDRVYRIVKRERMIEAGLLKRRQKHGKR